jgi:sugar phosphate isomerase/epimerase
MKIGLKSNCYNDKTWEETLDILKESGINAVEPGAGGYNGKAHCNPQELLKDAEAMKAFKKAADQREIEISALAVHGNPLHPQKSYAEDHIADLDAAIELAGKTGVKALTCFAGCPGASEKATDPNWITCPFPPYFERGIKWQWEKRVIPFWKKMAEKARKFKVSLGFEMHPGDVVYNTEALLMLREKVGAEEIACNFDPSHLFWQGMDPIECITRLKEAIVHVHAKDCKINERVVKFRGVNDPKHYGDIANRAWTFRTVGYGHGIEFWNDFVSTLRLVGYDGVLSIEHEDPLMSVNEGLQKTIDFLNMVLLHEPVGKLWWEI